MNTDPKQPAGKYMDVTHPAHVRPSATSRPIIVSSRPMLAADPMIAESVERAVTAHKTDDVLPSVDAETPSHDKNIEPPTSLATAPNLPPKQPEEVKREGAETDAPDTAANDEAPEEVGEPEVEPAVDTESSEAVEPRTETTEEVKETPSPSAAVLSTPAIDDAATEPDTPNPEDEAIARSEQIVADGTYFLPIGQVKHRGQRIVFGICLIVVLAVVVLDVLLDTGIISLAVPHTTFFSS